MYKALYRSYRPKLFDGIVGQDHIIKTLQNAIDSQKIGHAYLFSGPRGTGKTSIAHIFAKMINITAAGTEKDLSLDVIEIDAASNNGVTEIRALIDNAKYPPTNTKYKVYIVDEVHMLSKSAWNALLKILEEPPTYVVFILATTEAHKIPITILSRTQRFNFRRIDRPLIIHNLEWILKKEGISYDDESLRLISKLANGGMRDALSIADQVAAFGNGEINVENISRIFGVISLSRQIKLVNNMYINNIKDVIEEINGMFENGVDIERLITSLISIFKDYIIYSKTKSKELLHEISEEEVLELSISMDFAYNFSSELIDLLSKIKNTEMPKTMFELSFLKFMGEESEEESNKSKFQQSMKTKNETPAQLETNLEKIVDQLQHQSHPPSVEQEVKQSKTDESNNSINTENVKLVFGLDKTRTIEQIIPKDLSIDELTQVISGPQLHKNIDLAKKSQVNFEISDEQLLHCLIAASKSLVDSVVQSWELFNSIYRYDSDYSEYASFLASQKVISAGSNYILVSSKDEHSVKWIQDHWQTDQMYSLLEKMFAKTFIEVPLLIAIDVQKFKDIKEEFRVKKTNGTLPQPNIDIIPKYSHIPIDVSETQEVEIKYSELDEKSDDDELVSIFGEKFIK